MRSRIPSNLTRRAFVGTTIAALPALAAKLDQRHLISLSFDDGFEKSFTRTAEIYEQFELKACFNVIAGAHDAAFKSPDQWIQQLGNFDLWNDLVERGHEVMPHSYKHANLGRLPLEEAKALINRCLDRFDAKLKGFDRKRAVFNFPYNSSTPELEKWVLAQVRALRSGGRWVNDLPKPGQNRLSCTAWGPKNCENHLNTQIDKLLAEESGWLIYNLHGLDEEGWGPIRSVYLEQLLERLSAMPQVEVLPVGATLQKYAPL